MRRRFLVFLAIICLLAGGNSAAGDPAGRNQPPQAGPESVDLPGQIVSEEVRAAVAGGEEIPVLIKLKEDADDPSVSRFTTAKDASRFISKDKIKDLQSRLEKSFTPAELTRDIKIHHRLDNIPWLTASINRRALEKLENNPNVALIVEDRPVYANLAESGPLINADVAYSSGYTGSGVTVAVLDTGIDTDHPNLQDDLVWEECFLSDGGCPVSGSTRASGSGSAEDGHSHGTHVSGIITSSHPTYRGVAPDAGIVAVKVLTDAGSGWDSDIIAGIDWVTSVKDVYGISIINMSLGGGYYPGECDASAAGEAAAADAARSAGITIFAASGNDAYSSYMSSPACLSSVVSVGNVYDANVGGLTWGGGLCTDSTTQADKIACSSNASPVLDLLAPGALIDSCNNDGGFTIKGGTSMASPHAAGAAALLMEKNPALLPDDIKGILSSTGVSIYDSRNGMNFPRVNAVAALDSIIVSDLEVSQLDSPDPVTGGNNVTYTVTVANNGPDAAQGVVLTDTLPAGASFYSVASSQGSCSELSGTVQCAIGVMASGGSVVVTIVVSTPASAQVLTNTANVASSNVDPIGSNNTAIEETTVTAPVYSLNVSVVGAGTVTGTGISCPSDCSEPYVDGTGVTLTAVPDTGYRFQEWSGDMAGTTNPDSATMASHKNVTATFSPDINSSSFRKISGGYDHTLALKDDGTVWTWGANGFGVLGDGTVKDSSTPVQVSGLTDIISVAAGDWHNLALKADGSVWAWGKNYYGQLGNGTSTSGATRTPVQVSGLTNAVAVAAGYSHSLALNNDGTVSAWGYNGNGELGDGTYTNRLTPVPTYGLTDVISVAAGASHNVVLRADGTVWAWGRNNSGQLGDGTTTYSTTPVQVLGLANAVSVAAGEDHSLAAKDDGTVWAWGNNSYGQLGDGTGVRRTTPVQVAGLTNAVAVAAGYSHSLALNNDGTVSAWGYNGNGELGDGTTTDRHTRVQVVGLANVVSIASGYDHSLALKADGTVWGWGININDQLGDGKVDYNGTPVLVSGLSDADFMPSGYYHSLALKDDRTVWAWGDNSYGQLGDGTMANRHEPAQVSALSNVNMVAAGAYHSIALKGDGTAWAWGYNGYGQLGDGSKVNRTMPTRVSALSNVNMVAAGAFHSLALKGDGTVWAWGYNGHGQLGDGSKFNSTTPVQVYGLINAVAVTAGTSHSLAILDDGTVWAWGNNIKGQLGDGETTDRTTPVQVVGLTNAVSVKAGSYFTLALKDDGTVWAWGNNVEGQLGNGTTAEMSYAPVQIFALNNVIALAAGLAHGLALKDDGTVWVWGYNIYGQLGDGTRTSRSTPGQIVGLSRAVSVAAGFYHTLAVKDDGSFWGVGYNEYGQSGNGKRLKALSPIQSYINLNGNPISAFKFSKTLFSVAENEASAIITVSRIGDSAGPVSVDYSTEDITGTADADYTATSGTINFADGDMADKTFTIPITNDAIVELDETVSLRLGHPSGTAMFLDGGDKAWLNIANDDIYGVPWLWYPATSKTDKVSTDWGDSTTPGVTYELYEATLPDFSDEQLAYSGTTSAALLTNRSPGIYYYRVKAVMPGYSDSAWTYGSPGGCEVMSQSPEPYFLYVQSTSTKGTIPTDWNGPSDLTYQLYEATDPAFSDATVVYEGTASEITLYNRPNGTYYYRIRALREGKGWSAWVEGSSPCAVTLTVRDITWLWNPSSSPSGFYNVDWGDSNSGATYELEQDTHSAFSSPELVYSGSQSFYSFTSQTDGTYYYRVRALKDGWIPSNWTESTVACVVFLKVRAPTWIYVQANSLTGEVSVDWGNSRTSGVTYELYEATLSDFSDESLVYSGTVSDTVLTGRTSGTYYYRVRATGSGLAPSDWLPASNPCVVE